MVVLLFASICNITAQTNQSQIEQSYNPGILSGGKFGHISLEQGLSQSTVYALAQDAQGFIWFATQDGLNRYDGYTITVFRHKSNDHYSIIDNAISCLLSDPPDNLWIGTFKSGLDRYSTRENKFYHYSSGTTDDSSGKDNRISVLFKDSYGNIWAGSNNGISRYDFKSDSFKQYYYKKGSDFRAIKNINAIVEDHDKILWVGGGSGLFSISLKDLPKIDYLSQLVTASGLPLEKRVSSIWVDYSGLLWIGFIDDIIKCYNKEERKFYEFPQTIKGARPIIGDTGGSILFGSLYTYGLRLLNPYTKNVTLISDVQNDLVNAVLEDNTGIIWIGTYFHGVFTYDPRNNRFKHYLDNPRNPDVVLSILEDYQGGLWIGTFGNGIKYFNKNRDKVLNYMTEPGDSQSISSNTIMTFSESADHSIWIGTIGGGLDHFFPSTGKFIHYKKRNSTNQNGLSSNNVTALFKDHEDNLWIGYYDGEIDKYDESTGAFNPVIPQANGSVNLSGSTIMLFREDKKGTIWIATHGNGLCSYHPGSGTLKKCLITSPDSASDGNQETIKEISTFYQDDNGYLWIGSDEAGLIRYDPVSASSKIFSMKKLMAENTIYGILPDSSANLWLSTNNGLVRFNTKTEEYRVYDKNDGLQANEFNQGAYYKSRSGELFFGGVNGFNSFYPGRISDNVHIPPVYITSFKIFDKPVELPGSITTAGKIELSYSQNFFSFEFVALNYTLSQKNKYAYMLKGFDKDWHIVQAQQRYASYTNLDPGEYTLFVKASNNDGIWNESGATLSIVINPPFWMTYWFRLILIFIIAAIAYGLYRYKVKQLLAMERMRLRIANDLHDEMGSDLSAIALASQMTKGMDQSDKKRLDRIRENSLRVIETMREIVWFIKPEHDNPEKFLAKIKEVTASLLEGKKYELVIGSSPLHHFQDIESRQNLFLIYKECLTNIVRHSGCTEVRIELGAAEGNKLLSISDNGIGFDMNNVRKGSGLQNLSVRAARLNVLINIVTSPHNGTTIELFSAE